MSHRFSGRVGVIALLLMAAVSACGSRDNLFVLDDDVTVGGSAPGGATGGVGFGGRAGTGGAGGFGGHGGSFGGRGGASTFGGSAGFGGRGGSSGSGGRGGSAGFSGRGGSSGFGGRGGSAGFAGTGNVAGVGGSSGFSCAACLAQNDGTQPCRVAQCDLVNSLCDVALLSDGTTCPNSNACARNQCKAGACVEVSAITCPQQPCVSSACDTKSGLCVGTPLTGTACDDGNPCTSNDQCVMGACMPGTQLKSCLNNDKCCPAGCTSSNDNDCVGSTQVTLSATDRGWYENTGTHDPGNKNTFTGSDAMNLYNSYFTFDLSGVTGTIVSAQLALELESYYGTDASETASIWSVNASAAVVSMSTQSTAIFTDLQSGSEYGQFTASPNNINALLSSTLSGTALADLNAARGAAFAVGVHIDTLSGQTTTDEGLRFSEGSETNARHQLILTLQ